MNQPENVFLLLAVAACCFAGLFGCGILGFDLFGKHDRLAESADFLKSLIKLRYETAGLFYRILNLRFKLSYLRSKSCVLRLRFLQLRIRTIGLRFTLQRLGLVSQRDKMRLNCAWLRAIKNELLDYIYHRGEWHI